MTSYTCKKCGWSGNVNGTPRCLPCAVKATKKWKKENPEKFRAQRRRYVKSVWRRRPDEMRARRRRYYLPATARRQRFRRKDRLRAGSATATDLRLVYKIHNGKCAYCGTDVPNPRFSRINPRGFDHVVSLSMGGRHDKENIVVCCYECNTRKR